MEKTESRIGIVSNNISEKLRELILQKVGVVIAELVEIPISLTLEIKKRGWKRFLDYSQMGMELWLDGEYLIRMRGRGKEEKRKISASIQPFLDAEVLVGGGVQYLLYWRLIINEEKIFPEIEDHSISWWEKTLTLALSLPKKVVGEIELEMKKFSSIDAYNFLGVSTGEDYCWVTEEEFKKLN